LTPPFIDPWKIVKSDKILDLCKIGKKWKNTISGKSGKSVKKVKKHDFWKK
jgi:hypothetical protein